MQIASFANNKIMDTEGINHPLLEQLNLSCKYIAERRSVASCYHGSKSSKSQQSLSLDSSAKKTWISSTSFGQAAQPLSFCLPRTMLILGVRKIGGMRLPACPCWPLTILLTELQSSSVTNYFLVVNKLLFEFAISGEKCCYWFQCTSHTALPKVLEPLPPSPSLPPHCSPDSICKG